MKKYLLDFFKKYDYPIDAQKALLDAYDKVGEDEKFTGLLNDFYIDTALDSESVDKVLSGIEGAHMYTTKLLYYICLSRQLMDKYNEAGISLDIFYASMDDLRCKMFECFTVHGIWGSFVSYWFYDFFRMKLFTLGRLEYELKPYEGENVTVDGHVIKNGDLTINCHIPSSGKPFEREARQKSYDAAYEFYKDKFADANVVFMCCSWLLFPKHREMLPKGSNILSFMDDFTIVKSEEFPDGHDLWRIFGMYYDGNPDALPQNSSIQRAYVKWLKEGKKTGYGTGLFVYEPKK